MNQAIIFDLDGTLLNTDLLIKKSFIHAFEKYKPGYTLSEEELLSFLGPTLDNTFSRYFDQKDIAEIIDYYREYNHYHHKDYVTIYPTVKDTLETLKKQGYPLAIVTTKLKEAAYIGLDLFQIRDYFDVVIGCDEVRKSKPDPEGILKAMAFMKVDQAYYIGDNVTDIQAGKNAHIKTIGVKWSPKGYQALAALHPDLLIDQMDEIIEFIKGESE